MIFLETGMSYKNRKGEIITIVTQLSAEELNGSLFEYEDEQGRTYTEIGKYLLGDEHDFDIVEYI